MHITQRAFIRCLKYLVDYADIVFSFIFGWKLYEPNLEDVLKRLTKQELELIREDNFFMINLQKIFQELPKIRELSLTGRLMLRNNLLAAIKRRCKFDRYVNEHPEIKKVEIKNPVFIVTLFRTGSTFSHCLLRQDPNWFVTEIWMQQLLCPSPSNPLSSKDLNKVKECQKKIDSSQALCGWKNIRSMHNLTARDPEDMHFNISITGVQYWYSTLDGVEDYVNYIHSLPKWRWVEIYKRVKETLQCSAKDYQDARPLLMSHIGLNNMEALLEVFPDAQFITLHRDPVKSLNSAISLISILREAWYVYGKQKLDILPEKFFNLYIKELNEYMKLRKRIEDRDCHQRRFVDIKFKILLEKPIECMQEVYKKLNMKWSDQVAEKMQYYIKNQRQHKKATHRFEVNKDKSKLYYTAFRSYIDKFQVDCDMK
ncbi:DgyrCDS8269 [Dimorphilus gyrociliatus]|uniref:DgyrCDS8269 n=1 Tax=Dimorphilus gyrociliatus TaxID=2664684 RepID=A0A7I8VV85_9ANNE|nr:DgyrCDS8269 [Dimorphilus gyrociliatus]